MGGLARGLYRPPPPPPEVESPRTPLAGQFAAHGVRNRVGGGPEVACTRGGVPASRRACPPQVLRKTQEHKLYADAATVPALKHSYQPPVLHDNVTTLALLKAEIAKVDTIKTFVILNAVNTTVPPRDHIELFRYLYHPESMYLQEAYPPRVIVHVGDAFPGDIKDKYMSIFNEYSLDKQWVHFAESVRQVAPPSRTQW